MTATRRPPTRADIAAAFDAAYRASYGRLLQGGVTPDRQPAHRRHRQAAEVRSHSPWRRPKAAASRRRIAPEARPCRRAMGRHGGLRPPLAARRRDASPGPAILEQPDTTILIEPGHAGAVDRFGNVLITREAP
jgi:N-methylhydantoinase A